MIREKDDWEKDEIIYKVNDEYKVLIDIKSLSPSKAGTIAKGHYAVNGWVEWKNEKGETLDQVYSTTENHLTETVWVIISIIFVHVLPSAKW